MQSQSHYSIITVNHVFETLKKYLVGRFDPKLIIENNHIYIYFATAKRPSKGVIKECTRNGWEYDAENNCLTYHPVEIAELVTSDNQHDREQGIRHQKKIATSKKDG